MSETHRISELVESPKHLVVRVVSGPDRGLQRSGSALAVGTANNNQLVLTDPTVSRYHAELTLDPHRGVCLHDLDSSNGTFVGRVRVARGWVKVDQRLRLGHSIVKLIDIAEAHAVVSGFDEIPGIVGSSDAIRTAQRQIRSLAAKRVPILIQGETGSGKEEFARAAHRLSPRADGPFVIVDCGSLAPTLIASELFGHVRGAFTGATRDHVGAFERADGGTLFLDEIGELPLDMQPMLLGVLERHRVRRLGAERDRGVDVRIVAATHRDLRRAVNQGEFRADLFYRLAGVRILIPPLRERREDIPALVEAFVEQLTGVAELPFDAAAMKLLETHPWSGNVRELRNAVESALALGELTLLDSTAKPLGPRRVYREARAEAIHRFEYEFLSALIGSTGGNASEAARVAQMDRSYLLTLLRKHDLR